MSLFKLLYQYAPGLLCTALVLSALNSVAVLAFVTFATRIGRVAQTTTSITTVLLALSAILLVSGVLAPLLTAEISRRAVEGVRSRIVRQYLGAPLQKTERFGSNVIMALLTEDAWRLNFTLPSTISLVRDVLFFLTCSLVLIWLSPIIGTITLTAFLLVIYLTNKVRALITKRETRALKTREGLIGIISDIAHGKKELSVWPALRQGALSWMGEKESEIRFGVRYVSALSAVNETFVTLFSLAAIAVAGGYLANAGSIDGGQITYVAILVMMSGPMRSMSGSLQSLALGNASLERVNQISKYLESSVQRDDRSEPASAPVAPPAVRRLLFSGVTFRYEGQGDRGYELGPIDFELRAGSVLFVTGGNGSGKTTFVKLVSGLYSPTSGSIVINDEAVTESTRASYQEACSTLHYDFCLFESLAGSPFEGDLFISAELLRSANLHHVIACDQGLLSQVKSFSSGQRRRAALLLCLYRMKQIVIFDEYSADQDPAMRSFFYKVLLPELRALKKLVIVVTHDNRYFEHCDSMLKLERGMTPEFVMRPARSDAAFAESVA